jgi:hypothetical protein
LVCIAAPSSQMTRSRSNSDVWRSQYIFLNHISTPKQYKCRPTNRCTPLLQLHAQDDQSTMISEKIDGTSSRRHGRLCRLKPGTASVYICTTCKDGSNK